MRKCQGSSGEEKEGKITGEQKSIFFSHMNGLSPY